MSLSCSIMPRLREKKLVGYLKSILNKSSIVLFLSVTNCMIFKLCNQNAIKYANSIFKVVKGITRPLGYLCTSHFLWRWKIYWNKSQLWQIKFFFKKFKAVTACFTKINDILRKNTPSYWHKDERPIDSVSYIVGYN